MIDVLSHGCLPCVYLCLLHDIVDFVYYAILGVLAHACVPCECLCLLHDFVDVRFPMFRVHYDQVLSDHPLLHLYVSLGYLACDVGLGGLRSLVPLSLTSKSAEPQSSPLHPGWLSRADPTLDQNRWFCEKDENSTRSYFLRPFYHSPRFECSNHDTSRLQCSRPKCDMQWSAPAAPKIIYIYIYCFDLNRLACVPAADKNSKTTH